MVCEVHEWYLTFLTVVQSNALKEWSGGYYGTNGGKVSLPKVVGSNQSTNNDNQNGDGSGRFEKSWGSVYYRYNDGKRAKNAFIKDNDGNVYYFDNLRSHGNR